MKRLIRGAGALSLALSLRLAAGQSVSYTQTAGPLIATGGVGGAESQCFSTSLSGDGFTLACGAPSNEPSGGVYIYTRNSVTQAWQQQTPVALTGTGQGPGADQQGVSVSLNFNGTVLAFGSPGSASGGAAFIFTLNSTTKAWTQTAGPIQGPEPNNKDGSQG